MLLWRAWRGMVNFPAFADFLIATEAEMNKVSWTTRKRLVQDTIVVLTTVVLMTASCSSWTSSGAGACLDGSACSRCPREDKRRSRMSHAKW